MIKYFKFICVGLCIFANTALSFGAEQSAPFSQEQENQAKYLKNVMQKEIWSIILTDTFELQKEELKEGIIFKEYSDFNLLKYQEWMTEICVEEKTSSCPEVFFTKKTNIAVAAMYPNGKMYLNVKMLPLTRDNTKDKISNLFPEVARGLTDDEIYFAVAHEMGHFVLQHSLKNTIFMADSIVENGFMVGDMEKIVAVSFMVPGMRDYHHKIEDEADQFAIKYMKKKNIKVDCLKMFEKMIGEEKVSTEQHAGTEERCKKINLN